MSLLPVAFPSGVFDAPNKQFFMFYIYLPSPFLCCFADVVEFFRGGEGVILRLTHLLLIFWHLSHSPYITTNSSSFFFLPFFLLTLTSFTAVVFLYFLLHYILWSYSVWSDSVKLNSIQGKLTPTSPPLCMRNQWNQTLTHWSCLKFCLLESNGEWSEMQHCLHLFFFLHHAAHLAHLHHVACLVVCTTCQPLCHSTTPWSQHVWGPFS